MFQVGLIHFVSFRYIQKERCRISINKTILELFAEHVKKKPEQLAVIHKSEIKITNKELWELSGRIYAWLKSKGIDAEDLVMYNLPRGIELYACILGTLRAGAAFVLTETDNNPKRTEFIKQDCKCKLFVDEDCWKEIINTDSLDGYEPVNLHNLCYIAYTSGTTGSPKGVMHEYGSLENAWKSARYNGKPLFSNDDTFLVMSPMNFVSLPIIMAFSCAFGNTIAIMPYLYAENEEEFNKYIKENNINCGYLTPSFIYKHSEWEIPWKKCIISSEPADGLYLPNVKCYNAYASTESGCLLAMYEYTNPLTPLPVGKSQSDIKLFILDEEGKEVPQGNIGEICYKNPYVRGYINHPELTNKLIQDNIFHTSDAGKIKDEGNLIVHGRLDQMFKVRGYRIDTNDIADAVKKVSNLKNIVVKGVIYKDISSIIVFYTDNININAAIMRERLLNILPEYMIPTDYVHLEEFPLLETNKLDKQNLLPPEGSWENLTKISSPNLQLIAKGRTSDIYNFGDNKILKLYHRSIPFNEINKELDLINTVSSFGVPTPYAYEIVRSSNNNYGIIMDKLNGITIEQAIKNNPDKQKFLIKKFTQAIKKLHRTQVQDERIPDIKQTSIMYAKQLNSSFCSNEDKTKIIKIFENIPNTKNFLHGDYHTGNAIITDNKIQFIDLMFCAKGHPVFDILCMYSHYVFLPSFDSDEACILNLGLDKTGAEKLYNLFIKMYYNDKTDNEIANVKEYIKGVHAARICLADVALANVFSNEILQTAKKRALAFYEQLNNFKADIISSLC